MHKIDTTPIFYEFLDMFLSKTKSKIKIKKTNKLFLYDKCVCGKNNCNSFILRTINKISEGYYVYHTIKTNKGTFGIELCDDGTFVFVALDNADFPFKKEFDRMFKNYKKTVRKRVLPLYPKSKLTKKDKEKLHRFFLDFKVEKDYMLHYVIDQCIKEYM